MAELKHTEFYEDELDLMEILRVLIKGKWLLISITTTISIISVIYSLLLPNIYESRALLASSMSSNQTNFVQNYSSLASIAGINIPSQSNESNALQAQEKFQSLSFFEGNILPNIFLPDLMAFKSWNPYSNINEYDESNYNEDSGEWVVDSLSPQKLKPSAQESFNIFKKEHLIINIDKKTNFVTVKIRHQSPYIAATWANLLVSEINSFYRKKDKDEAEKAVNYLNTLAAKTNFSEILEVIASLLKKEMQKLTLIEANEYYVYEYIDPPAVMEKKVEPLRLLIVAIGAITGFMAGIVIILFRFFVTKNEKD